MVLILCQCPVAYPGIGLRRPRDFRQAPLYPKTDPAISRDSWLGFSAALGSADSLGIRSPSQLWGRVAEKSIDSRLTQLVRTAQVVKPYEALHPVTVELLGLPATLSASVIPEVKHSGGAYSYRLHFICASLACQRVSPGVFGERVGRAPLVPDVRS
jgi:hypothetical protein